MNFEQENIRLRDAMTKELKHKARSWCVPGLQIEVKKLPENAIVSRTVVEYSHETNYFIIVKYTIEGDSTIKLVVSEEFSTLEELQKKHPHLFELDGHLYAFS